MSYKIILAKVFYTESEMFKVRPMIVLSEPQGEHKFVTCAFVTTKQQQGDIKIVKGEHNDLAEDSYARLSKIFTISNKQIHLELGSTSQNEELTIKNGLRDMFDL